MRSCPIKPLATSDLLVGEAQDSAPWITFAAQEREVHRPHRRPEVDVLRLERGALRSVEGVHKGAQLLRAALGVVKVIDLGG